MEHVKTVQYTEIHFSPYDRAMIVVSSCQFPARGFGDSPQTSALKRGTALSTAKIFPLIGSLYYSLIGSRIQVFRSVPNLVTLDDLERRNGCYFALLR